MQLLAKGGDLNCLLKRHSVRDAIFLLKQTWDELPQNVIKKAWSKVLNWDSGEFDSEDDLPLAQWILQNQDNKLKLY